MSNKEIISQLESLKENSQSFFEDSDPDSVWEHDIMALDAAIALIREYPHMKKQLHKLEQRLSHRENRKDPYYRARVRVH